MRKLIIFLICIIVYSCSKDEVLPIVDSNFRNGIFVLNEGNYTWQNASVSYIDLDSGKVENNLFLNTNRKSLGDVAQSFYEIDSLLFIVVNNSSKIEIVSKYNFKSIGTIQNLLSPRYMIQIDDQRAFVSDLYSKYLKVINFKTFEILDSIYLGKSSENLLKYKDKVFVTNWSRLGMSEIANNTVQIININTLTLDDSILVNTEPCGLQMDKDENLWVLCSGSFLNTDNPALYKINPDSYSILNKLEFPSNNSPKHLLINNLHDSLFYINSHFFSLSIYDNQIPDIALIRAEGVNFYNASVSPYTGDIFISDVLDYVQYGNIYQFDRNGIPLDTFEVKITPSEMLFINSK